MTQAAILAQSGSPGTTTGFKNRLINGAMLINQRNFSGNMSTAGAALYTLDRWQGFFSLNDKYSVSQNAGSVTTPAQFPKYLGCTSLASTSVSSGDYYFLQQVIEANNMSDLAWGTASAKTITLSFQVYSSLTGTFSGSIENYAGNRSYPFTYTVSSANTWTSISVTIPGDTSGTWSSSGTSGWGSVNFNLGSGSSILGTAGAWASGNYIGSTGSQSIIATSGATWYLTGVQLEVGTTATNFDFRSYGTELFLCQRYYETMGFGLLGIANSATGIWAQMIYKVQKRATPTVGLYTTTQTWGQFGIANRNSSGVSIGDSANTNAWGSVTRIEGFSGITTNAPLGSLTDTVFTLSAEL
jgi:hypothetical protein